MTFLIIILALVAIILIVPLFTKKGYAIERQVLIDHPKQEVFNYLKHLKNQDHFSKWVMTDPNMKKEYKGVDGEVGFVYAWDGNMQAGKGEQEIMGLTDGEKVDLEVRFVKPFEATAKTPFTIESVSGNQTMVKWSMVSEMKYPMNIMLLFMNMEKMLGKDMEISLNHLKNIMEAR